jgi:phosphoribosylformylglycinamidine cyclo-ligase
VQGAEPLFFLDYFACGRLDVPVAATVVAGIAAGCEQAGCALIGGETAEMPGMYKEGEYDLAGFAVGVVEKSRIVDGRTCREGDALIGLASSGPHSNGFSLIRRILDVSGADLHAPLGAGSARSLGEALLAPTRIYVKPVLQLLDAVPVKGMAHITGGGLTENVPRMLGAALQARIEQGRWPRPAIFEWLAAHGHVEEAEMHRVFNCGIGFVIAVAPGDAERAIAFLRTAGEDARLIGEIVARAPGAPGAVVV